jgi:hypothetical protein
MSDEDFNLDCYVTPEHLEEDIPKMVHPGLRHYAEEKVKAMRFRVGGHIAQASKHERLCDRIYKALPERLRW